MSTPLPNKRALFTLVISGWKIGLDKIMLTKIIRRYTGCGLPEGKQYTDQVLDGETVHFSQLHREVAESFLREVEAIGAMEEIKPENI